MVAVEPGVKAHAREMVRQRLLGNLHKTPLLIEAMGRPELLGRAQQHVLHSHGSRPIKASPEERGANPYRLPAVTRRNEHLPERALSVADIQEPDRADKLRFIHRHPERPMVFLIMGRDVSEIRLLFQRDGNSEFLPLNAEDEPLHAVGVLGDELTDYRWHRLSGIGHVFWGRGARSLR
jgi:hypothetical protein